MPVIITFYPLRNAHYLQYISRHWSVLALSPASANMVCSSELAQSVIDKPGLLRIPLGNGTYQMVCEVEIVCSVIEYRWKTALLAIRMIVAASIVLVNSSIGGAFLIQHLRRPVQIKPSGLFVLNLLLCDTTTGVITLAAWA